MDKSNRRPHRSIATNTVSASTQASTSASVAVQRSSSSDDLPNLDLALPQPPQASTSRRNAVRPIRTGKKRKQIPPTDSELSEDEPRPQSGAAPRVAHLADGRKRPKPIETRPTPSSSASAQQHGSKTPSRVRLTPLRSTGQREPAPPQNATSSGSEIEIVPSQRSSQTPNSTLPASRQPSQRLSFPTNSRRSNSTNAQLPASPTTPIWPSSPPPEVKTDQIKAVLANTFRYLIIQGPEVFSDRQAFAKMTESARDLMNRTSDDMELGIYRAEFEEKENQLKQSDRDLENKITMLVEPVVDALTAVVQKQSEAQLKLKSHSELTKLHAIIDSQSKSISTNDARWTAFEQRVTSLDAKLEKLGPRLETAEAMESRLTKLEESMRKSDESLSSLSNLASLESLKEQDTRWQHMLANKLDSVQAKCRQIEEAQHTQLQSKLAELDTSQTTRLENRLTEFATEQAKWAVDEVRAVRGQLIQQKQSLTAQLDRLGAKLAEFEGNHQSQLDHIKSQMAGVTLQKQASPEALNPSVGSDATVAEAVSEERHSELMERMNTLEARVSHLDTDEDGHRQNQHNNTFSRDLPARSSVESAETVHPKTKVVSPASSEQRHVSPNGNPGNASAVRLQRPGPASLALHRSSLESNLSAQTQPLPYEVEALAANRAGFPNQQLWPLYNYISKRIMHSTWLADMIKAKLMESTKEPIAMMVVERLNQIGLNAEKMGTISRLTEKLLGFEPDKFVRRNEPGYLSLFTAVSECAAKELRGVQEASNVKQRWIIDKLGFIEKQIGPLLSRIEFAETSISDAISINDRGMATVRQECEARLAAVHQQLRQECETIVAAVQQQPLEQARDARYESPRAHHGHLQPAFREGESGHERPSASRDTKMLSLPTIESHIVDCLIRYSDPNTPALSSGSEREEGEEDEIEDGARAVEMRESDDRSAKWIQFFKQLREIDAPRHERVVILQTKLDQHANNLRTITEIINQAIGRDVTAMAKGTNVIW